jgi:hypothetical protein
VFVCRVTSKHDLVETTGCNIVDMVWCKDDAKMDFRAGSFLFEVKDVARCIGGPNVATYTQTLHDTENCFVFILVAAKITEFIPASKMLFNSNVAVESKHYS